MPMAPARDFSVPGRLRSFRYAARGLRILFVSQHNAWIDATATLLVVAGGFHLGIERQEWLALILAMVSVWAAEALNTALEVLGDAASSDFIRWSKKPRTLPPVQS